MPRTSDNHSLVTNSKTDCSVTTKIKIQKCFENMERTLCFSQFTFSQIDTKHLITMHVYYLY